MKYKSFFIRRTKIFLFFIIPLINLCEGNIERGKANCKDFAGLKKDIVGNIGTRSKMAKNTVLSLPTQIEVVVMKRDVWNSYCYQGSIIDPNTGCSPQKITTMLPDQFEAETWLKRGECQIGETCLNWQENCLGDGAKKCLNNELTNWVKESKGGYGGSWMKFPYHTCTKTWNCKIIRSMVTPNLVVEDNIRTEINIMNEWYTVYKEGKYTNYFKSDKNKLALFIPNFKVALESSKTKCMEVHNVIECLVTNSITGIREIIEVTSDAWSVGRTTAIKNAKTTNITMDINRQREELTRSASINDLKRSILANHYTQIEIDNSFDVVNMNFLKLNNMIMGILEYTTKKDDEAFSVITGDQKIMKWISPKTVRVCEVNELFWNKRLGCENGSHYAGGSYYSTQRYKCNKFDEVIKPYNLNLKLETLGNLTTYDVKTLGTTNSEKINRELMEERINEIEAKIEISGKIMYGQSGPQTGILNYFKPSFVFSMISDYLVYINTALIVLLYLKR